MKKPRRVRNTGPAVPTVDDVLSLHEAEVKRSGNPLGTLNRGSLEAAVDRAVHGPFEGPGSVFERADLLLRGICQDHPFADANKRTSFAATHMFLRRNGFKLDVSDEEVRDFMLRVAKIELDLDGRMVWFSRYVETIKEPGAP